MRLYRFRSVDWLVLKSLCYRCNGDGYLGWLDELCPNCDGWGCKWWAWRRIKAVLRFDLCDKCKRPEHIFGRYVGSHSDCCPF